MTGISFDQIPSQINTPGNYIENDGSQASGGGTTKRALIIGVFSTSGNDASADTLYEVSSVGHAAALFGTGSPIYHQIQRYRDSDPIGRLFAIGVTIAGGSAATGKWTVTTGVAAAGTFYVYTGDRSVERIPVDVSAGDSETTIAASIAAAVLADSPYLTATSAFGVVTFTARLNSTLFHDVRIKYNEKGAVGGEVLPDGVSIAYTNNMGELAAGAGTIDLTNAIAAMGDEPFDFINCGVNDTTNVALLAAEMNDATGRWSYDSKIYGHVFMGKQATQSELVTYGALVDDQHFSCFGVEGSDDGGAVGVYDPLSLTASWAWGAGVMGAIAVANRANAARPYLKLEVRGNMAPAPGDRFNKIEVETLLGEGIATTYYTQSGSVHIQEAITTYTTDAGGEDDDAYREYTTISKLTETNRDLENHLSTKYPRAVLTDDPLPPGAPSDGTYVAPSTIEGGILGRYREWIRLGYCRDYDGYADELVVKRNFQDGTGDRNRVDIFNPARMTGSLTKTATRTSFRF